MRLQSTFPELESIAQRMGAKPSLVDQMINEVDVIGYGSSSANVNGNQTMVIVYNGQNYQEVADHQWAMIIYSSPNQFEVIGISEDQARTFLD